jgi:hypothetical protein
VDTGSQLMAVHLVKMVVEDQGPGSPKKVLRLMMADS